MSNRSGWHHVISAALVLAVVSGAVAQAAPGDTLRAAGERVAQSIGAPIVVSGKRGTGLASFVRRVDRGDLSPRPAADKAEDFVSRHGHLFGLSPGAPELAAPTRQTDGIGWTHVVWRQRHAGLEVFGATLRAHLAPDGTLRAMNGALVAIAGPLAVTPVIPAGVAERIAIASARDVATFVVDRRLVIYDRSLLHPVESAPRLAHAVETEASTAGHRDLVLVDALDGRVLDRLRLTPDALSREVSHNSIDNVVWSEGDPDPIPPGWSGGSGAQVGGWQDEIDGARESYAFHGSLSLGTYLSFDGADAAMVTLHDPPTLACPNAAWNGAHTNFCPGVTSDDVVSHEWGHAYTQYTSGLVYAWQPGALNESYSDVWGESVDLLNGRETDTPGGLRASNGSACSTFGTFEGSLPATDATYRWLVSEDSTSFGGAIRDMWHPECRFDPGRVGSPLYHCETSDSGGVHTNSGIPNHLYALMVDGGTFNGETITGIGLTKAANILWRALSVYEIPVSDFADHADAVEQSCADLVGATLGEPVTTAPSSWTSSSQVISAADCAAVAAAISAVELRDPPPCVITPILQPNPPALCSGAGAIETIALADFESGLAPWSAGTRAVANPGTYDGGTWMQATTLPDGRSGAAAFTADPIMGDCDLDDETGVSFLESPDLVAPVDRSRLRVAFSHWIATENGYDGGNVKVSVNGGGFQVVPPEHFSFNAYNQTLRIPDNTCPLAGEPAWSGSDGGSFSGSWGESQLDLEDLVEPGDTVRLRFELGTDGCNGNTGWYVDDVRVYTCSAEVPLCQSAPLPGCKQTTLGRSKLIVKDDPGNIAKNRLQWSWSKGAATTFAELGDPLATTRYALCVWDGRAGSPELVASAEIPPGSRWTTNGTSRLGYKDTHALQDGVSVIKLRAAPDGRASASLQGKGVFLDVPDPATPATRFEANPAVTVQLVSSAGTCWQSTFAATDFRFNTLPRAQAIR